MGKIIKSLASILLGFGLSIATVHADTIVSVTETHYDAMNRPDCAAERMNPATFGGTPANGCALDSPGSFGPDRITHTVYDNVGQVLEVDQAYGITTANGFPQTLQRAYARYSYNPNGTKATEMDANGNKTMYVYDGFDRLSQLQYPSTTVGSGNIDTADYELFGYDANNNRISWRRRNGKTISYGYDALNREITRAVSDGSVQTVYTGYDLLGDVLFARYGSTSGAGITNTYDGLARLSTTTDMNGRQIGYGYNQASAKASLQYSDGAYIGYFRDSLNRLTLVDWENGTGGVIAMGYDNLGRRAYINRPTFGTAYSYDNLGRLTSLDDGFPSSTYAVTWTFAYSPANQIASTSDSNTVFDYQETANTTTNNTYDGLNRDAGIAALSGGFDGDGNLANDGTRTFTYDVYNHLLTETAAGSSLSLIYDPLGRLASQTYNGATTSFQYDGTNLIAEYNGSGTMVDRYLHGDNEDEPLVWFQGSQSTTPLYLVQDYHGSVIAYTDTNGNVDALYKYGPYGEPKDSNNATDFTGARFRYTGQMVIPEASLYYYKARVYDPIFGRFLQTDPIGSKDDLDLYAYTADDPIDHGDPTGLETGQVAYDSITAIDEDRRAHGTQPQGELAATVVVYGAAGCAAAPAACARVAQKAGIGALTGAAVNGTVAAMEGKPIGPAAVNGAISGAATGATGALVPGRGAKAVAVGIASAGATKATGGSDFEAGLAGTVSGGVEYITGNEKAANAAALGMEGLIGDITKSLTKKTVSSVIKEPTKNGCQAVNGGNKC